MKLSQEGQIGMESLVKIVIGVIIFSAMLPIVTDTIASVEATGTEAILLDYLPLFIVLGVLLAIIVWAIEPVGSSPAVT